MERSLISLGLSCLGLVIKFQRFLDEKNLSACSHMKKHHVILLLKVKTIKEL